MKIKISKEDINNIINKYFCCCCLHLYNKYYNKKKISPEDLLITTTDTNEINNLQLKNKNEVSNNILIKKFVRKWEKGFWPKFWIHHANNLLKKKSAIKIQTMIRGFLGRVYYKRRLLYAINEMNEFWRLKREQKLLEKEKLRIAKETRHKVNSLF